MGDLLVDIKKNLAYLLITCNVGKIDDVISQIKNLIFIQEVQRTCGAYDIIAKAESNTQESLQKFVLEQIKSIGNVRSSITLHCKPIL